MIIESFAKMSVKPISRFARNDNIGDMDGGNSVLSQAIIRLYYSVYTTSHRVIPRKRVATQEQSCDEESDRRTWYRFLDNIRFSYQALSNKELPIDNYQVTREDQLQAGSSRYSE